MFRNYLITAIRNIKRHKAFSFINITGLAAGMAVCILAFLFVQYELSFDKFFKDYKSIDRLYFEASLNGNKEKMAILPAGIADYIRVKYPEVQSVARMRREWQDKELVDNGNVKSYEPDIVETEQSFFDVFDYKLAGGERNNLLTEPNSAVITEEIAGKYFGNENPLYKTIIVGNEGNVYRITGVLKNIPKNSHLRFGILIAFDRKEIDEYTGQWGAYNYTYYIKRRPGADLPALQNKMLTLYQEASGDYKSKTKIMIQPIDEIHLSPGMKDDKTESGSYVSIYIFSTLGILVLLLACINFINLSTAKGAGRSMEIGLRKAVGANKKELTVQFLIESMLIASISVMAALIIILPVIPVINKLGGVDIKLDLLNNSLLLPALCALTLLTGFLAGSYPAFYLSSFNPVNVMKRKSGGGGRSGIVSSRKALVVFQFVVTSCLIIAAAVILSQMNYIKNKNLGYEKEQILVVPMLDYGAINDFKVIKTKLQECSGVKGVTSTSSLPTNIIGRRGFIYEGKNGMESRMIYSLTIDSDFLHAFNVKLLEGRNLDFAKPEGGDEYIINETAAKTLGLDNPVGKKMGQRDILQGEIIGVVKDFNFESLHEAIQPLVLHFGGNPAQYMHIKFNTSYAPQIVGIVKDAFEQVIKNKPFEYFFLDEQYDSLYKTEEKLASFVFGFSILSIFIASIGLTGLIMYSNERRKKEIGIRKVLGADVKGILFMLSKEYLLLITAAFAIAAPISYYSMNLWLRNFAYKTEMSVWIFLAAMAVSLFIAAATITMQTIRAAAADPVKSIKHE
jgi:putative ABC transport system permease protein